MEAGPGQPAAGAEVRRTRRPTLGPQRYDFRRPSKLSREHVRALQIANETFARQFSTILTTTLRAVSQVSLASVEQLSYDEYIASLANPTLMAVLSIEPLPGLAILELALSSSMTAVDHLLGGSGGPQPQRPLTEIETALLRGLVARVLAEMPYAYESLVRLDPAIVRLEFSPQFAQVAAPSDVVVVTSFDLRIGGEECVATLCVPFGALQPSLDAAIARNSYVSAREAVDEWAQRVTDRVVEAPVGVEVRFDPVQLTPAQILGLAVGDVVRLGQSVSAPLTLTVGDVPVAKAVPGSSGRRLACMIVEP